MESLRTRIIKAILEKKDIDKRLLTKINKETKSFRELKQKLIENKLTTEEDIILVLSKECRTPYFDLNKYRLSPENRNLLPKNIAFKHTIIPISKIGEVLTIATADPVNILALDDIGIICSFKKIDLILADENKILRALNGLYSEKAIPAFLSESEDESSVEEITQKDDYSLEEVLKESKKSPIVKVVDLIIYEGLKRQSSDIHIEPTETDLAVRYRVDGILHHGLNLPKINQSAILARLKIMSNLNITEFRNPQDGRFKIKFEGREIDFRVSSLPANFGEKIVLRILDRQSLSLGLANLGFSKVPLEIFQEAIRAPFGIILVTGPTGSGKSTTLYSVINMINGVEKNIITIENPVEYQLEGITQIQVNPNIGLTFAGSLRSTLRQSPDIIMVGEIRDSETADIAIKASLTGQFIFSTLHTNNSIGAITRLADMGIEPFLIASSLIASTAQRLVRKLCPKCKEKYSVDKKILEKMGFSASLGNEFCKIKGCKHCNNTGYKGRIALLEILSIDDSLKTMIVNKATEAEIINYATKKRHFRYLKEDGFQKCLDGVTTLEEVLRVAG
ncbi:MAG: type II/IV secretion system protein [Candidatus Omnitrophica bacterium]|nr:type II/IV secretion system protein [Candidatus Omnitrophota bacterium]